MVIILAHNSDCSIKSSLGLTLYCPIGYFVTEADPYSALDNPLNPQGA
jgi:hypothetical protein